MRRHEIKDEDWVRIKDMLPGQPGDPGVTAKDNRLFLKRRPLDRQDRGTVARAAGTIRPLGLGLEAVRPMGQERGVGADLRVPPRS